MRRYAYILLALFCTWVIPSVKGQTYQTQTFTNNIKTLQVHNANSWDLPPIINTQKGEQVEVSFDLISASQEYCTYRILHCDADWQISNLVESEYMDGLQYNPIEDYAYSFNTQPQYVNYKLLIPNDKVDLKISGNYVVEIYNEINENPIVTACFSVVDPKVKIGLDVSSVTDKGANSKYQAVSFDINYGSEVRSPAQDFKVYVQQNNRRDNQASMIKPMSLQGNKAVYDHNQSLIFEGGNEYYTFEMTTIQFNGINIDKIEYHSPFYHVMLRPNKIRTTAAYSFYNDINGRILIRNINFDDAELESDYRIVHFFLACENPLTENVYILSQAFNNVMDENSRMTYDAQLGGYTKSVLLKEGYYNYQYVTKKNASSPGSFTLTEGNHFQTENEYTVFVYFRPFGERYDQLIGVETIQYK